MSSEQEWPPLPPLSAGLRGHCPRSSQCHLFSSVLKLRSHCKVCGLDHSSADPVADLYPALAAVEGLAGGPRVLLQGRGSPFRYDRANPATCGPSRRQRLALDLTTVSFSDDR